MKLAEALALRADLQKKNESLRSRIAKNAVVQEDSKPHEDPNKLLKEATGVLKELHALIAAINATNVATTLKAGQTLTQAMAERDRLAQHHSILTTAIQSSHKEPDRYAVSEIRWVTTMDVKKLQKQSEDIAKTLRELNLSIQQCNWETDLIE